MRQLQYFHMPPIMKTQYELDLVAASYEQHGHAYAKKRLGGGMLFNDYIEAPIVRSLLGEAQRLNGANVLDIGCGPGIYSSLLLRAGANVLGVDSSLVMLKATEEYCSGINSAGCGSARFLHSTFEEADLADEKFDLVLATFMLSYFENLESALSKIRDHLSPKGRTIVSMLHPVRLFSTSKGSHGYTVSDYFGGGYYAADFLHNDAALPLKRYNFEELFDAIKHSGLKVLNLLEPRASLNCGFPDDEKVRFYSAHPSILVMQLAAK